MKRLQTGFCALIAIMAMAFALQTQSNWHSSRVLRTDAGEGCYRSLAIHVPDPYDSFRPLTVTLTAGNLTLYSTNHLRTVWSDYDMGIWYIPGYPSPLGIYSYWPGTVVNDFTVAVVGDDAIGNRNINCPQPYTTFCCFVVQQDYYDNSKYRVTGVALKRLP